jgi:hypothetical protein
VGKKNKDYDAYEKLLGGKLQKLIHECANKIVATAQHEPTVAGKRPEKSATSKTSTTNKMETRKSPRKEVSMTEDSPDRKCIRSQVKETS